MVQRQNGQGPEAGATRKARTVGLSWAGVRAEERGPRSVRLGPLDASKAGGNTPTVLAGNPAATVHIGRIMFNDKTGSLLTLLTFSALNSRFPAWFPILSR